MICQNCEGTDFREGDQNARGDNFLWVCNNCNFGDRNTPMRTKIIKMEVTIPIKKIDAVIQWVDSQNAFIDKMDLIKRLENLKKEWEK